MKVYIDGKLYDCEKQAIALIFKNDDELSLVASHLSNMEPKPGKERGYIMGPNRKQNQTVLDWLKARGSNG